MNKKNLRRFLALVLTLATLFALMCVPVQAATKKATKKEIQEMLDDGVYLRNHIAYTTTALDVYEKCDTTSSCVGTFRQSQLIVVIDDYTARSGWVRATSAGLYTIGYIKSDRIVYRPSSAYDTYTSTVWTKGLIYASKTGNKKVKTLNVGTKVTVLWYGSPRSAVKYETSNKTYYGWMNNSNLYDNLPDGTVAYKTKTKLTMFSKNTLKGKVISIPKNTVVYATYTTTKNGVKIAQVVWFNKSAGKTYSGFCKLSGLKKSK